MKFKEINSLKWPVKILKFLDNYQNGSQYSLSKGISNKDLSVLADQEEVHPISPDGKFEFSKYSAAICNIIRTSNRKFSIGIFSEWGTGKTTLMRLIEKDLRTTVCNSSSPEITIDDLKKLIANFYDIKPVNLTLRKKNGTVE